MPGYTQRPKNIIAILPLEFSRTKYLCVAHSEPLPLNIVSCLDIPNKIFFVHRAACTESVAVEKDILKDHATLQGLIGFTVCPTGGKPREFICQIYDPRDRTCEALKIPAASYGECARCAFSMQVPWEKCLSVPPPKKSFSNGKLAA